MYFFPRQCPCIPSYSRLTCPDPFLTFFFFFFFFFRTWRKSLPQPPRPPPGVQPAGFSWSSELATFQWQDEWVFPPTHLRGDTSLQGSARLAYQSFVESRIASETLVAHSLKTPLLRIVSPGALLAWRNEGPSLEKRI